jgi:hypothetical protein
VRQGTAFGIGVILAAAGVFAAKMPSVLIGTAPTRAWDAGDPDGIAGVLPFLPLLVLAQGPIARRMPRGAWLALALVEAIAGGGLGARVFFTFTFTLFDAVEYLPTFWLLAGDYVLAVVVALWFAWTMRRRRPLAPP